MITEDYVSFETAKLLKEKGFNELTPLSYSLPYGYESHIPCSNGVDTDFVSRITLQMAMKWLREVHHLTIDVFHFRDWNVNIKTIPDDYFKADYSYPELKPAETYEQACEAAIRYCLENLV